MAREGFWRWYDRASRMDFGGTLLGLFVDWKVWLFTTSGGVLSMFTAAYDGWSVTVCLLAFVGGLGVFALLAAGTVTLFRTIKLSTHKNANTPNNQAEGEFINDIPDVRIADDLVAWGLFETTKDQDKLIPLLEGGKLQAWGRLGNGHPPPTKIPADNWATHFLDHRPADSPGRISQTYFRPRSRPYESTYYDVHLNREQLERAWPGLWQQTSLDRIPCTELMKMATDRGWDFTSHESLHLLDLQKAIRQGASDNHLAVWGRLKRWSSEELLRNEILENIPLEHWRTFYVYLFPALEGDNFHTKSWTPSETPQNYLDLHVNRREAAIWLDRDAIVFRGKTTPNQRGIP
jgi:hypothetical protein